MQPDDRELVSAARRLAKRLLRKPLIERWLHTQGVAQRAGEVAVTVPEADRPRLISAAWLHDIGYSPAIRQTGFHPLDGALYLREQGWAPRLVALVAHHSGARFVPVERGFADMMA
ncbi:MAG TPA: HD domain-containing protein, partial [Nakamurella sp.]